MAGERRDDGEVPRGETACCVERDGCQAQGEQVAGWRGVYGGGCYAGVDVDDAEVLGAAA